jgi:hypothetical protein
MDHNHTHEHSHEHTHEHTHEDRAHSHAHTHAHTHEHSHDEAGHTHEHPHEHPHEHSDDHAHTHTHGGDGGSEKETFALIRYMLSHNTHHAEELTQLSAQLAEIGKPEAAALLKQAVSYFTQGNAELEKAVRLIEG